MRTDATPVSRSLVLVGGGHSHVEVLRRFGMDPLAGVRVTVVSRDVRTPYSGMLPGHVAGHYERDEILVDLRPLCRFAGARLYHDTVVGIDLDEGRVLCRSRPSVAFDLLSVNVGAAPRTEGIPGAAEHAVPVKPVDRFLERWDELARRLESGDLERCRIGVVGAGAGGVEVGLAVVHRLETLLGPEMEDRVELHVVGDAERVLPGHGRGVRRRFARILDERGVRVHTGRRVARVEAHALVLEDGERIAVDRAFLVTDAAPPDWIGDTGLDTDERGFLQVDPTLRSTSHPRVFAAGDVAAVRGHPRPRAGVFAVRQGPPLARNLRRVLRGAEAEPFRPQKRFLSLVSAGERYAVASWGPLSLGGRWVWKLKDRIDRRWIRRYRELPEMERAESGLRGSDPVGGDGAPEGPWDHSMRCGGCGAKVGPSVLERVLERLDPGVRDDVLLGLAAPDDAAVLAVPPGMVSVQSVDWFPAFLDDPWTLGRVAANHALGDLWAMGAGPQSALALATLPPAAEDPLQEELFQLLSGALDVLRRHGAVLAGGHTTEGPELAFGLQVSGLARPDELLRKSGMRPGQALVLTSPLGTGALFAADMRGRARADWIEHALARMTRSQEEAGAVLRAHGATACTDVTGFGLVGHLLEMVRASGVSARIRVSRVPLLDGARACVEAGITSSLYPENLRLRRGLRIDPGVDEDARFSLLFDPQTGGGLLASLPADAVEACVRELREAGYGEAAQVGGVEEAGDRERPLTLL